MYHIQEAQTGQDYHNLYTLRYKVYCLEKKWLDASNYPNRLEKDAYDPYAKHFIAKNDDQKILGTLRLILSDKLPRFDKLPFTKHPHVDINPLNLKKSAEISRLVIDKVEKKSEISLCLYRIVYQYSKKIGIERLYVVIDSIFLRFLNGLGFPFKAIGRKAEYMGQTIPAMGIVKHFEEQQPKKNMHFYQWLQAPPYTLEESGIISRYFSKKPTHATPQAELFSRNWAFIPADVQQKLAETRLLIAGSGLGSVVAELAVRTGFGKFIIADGDVVDVSNLNRQAFNTYDINQNKSEMTKYRLKRINSHVEIESIPLFLTPESLEEPIVRSDIIVNTIDFDHPAFLDCNTKARLFGKPVLFPLNIGWGGALLVFEPDSVTLEEMLSLTPEEMKSYDLIKQKLILKILASNIPAYLFPLTDIFKKPTRENWPNDPQICVGCSITSSLVITAAVSLSAGKPVKTSPEFIHIDLHELVQKNVGEKLSTDKNGIFINYS